MTKPIDWENPFTASAFDKIRTTLREYLYEVLPERVKSVSSDIANARFRELLEQAETVYKSTGYGHFDTWREDVKDLDAPPTHSAKLIAIKELK